MSSVTVVVSSTPDAVTVGIDTLWVFHYAIGASTDVWTFSRASTATEYNQEA